MIKVLVGLVSPGASLLGLQIAAFLLYAHMVFLLLDRGPVPNSPFESQYSRDKCWWERKGCFIEEVGNLEKWQINVSNTHLPCSGETDF